MRENATKRRRRRRRVKRRNLRGILLSAVGRVVAIHSHAAFRIEEEEKGKLFPYITK
jgi:hypothetical protein